MKPARANVLRYTEEWEQVVGRLGRWVDFENDYKTMDLPFHGKRMVGFQNLVGKRLNLSRLQSHAI